MPVMGANGRQTRLSSARRGSCALGSLNKDLTKGASTRSTDRESRSGSLRSGDAAVLIKCSGLGSLGRRAGLIMPTGRIICLWCSRACAMPLMPSIRGRLKIHRELSRLWTNG
jgi:hypothetical protein